MKLINPLLAIFAISGALRAAELTDLLPERLKSVVAVEFVIETEIDRRPSIVLGTVVDARGTIILPGSAIAPGIAPDQIKEFKVYLPDSREGHAASYLGQDAMTSWHFFRAEEKLWSQLVPVTRFAGASGTEVKLDDELWGIGLRNKDEEFMPYVLSSRVAMITRLPNKTAILAQDVAGPGLPVFTRDGRLAGIAQNSFGQNFLLFSRNQNGAPVLLVNIEESSVVQLAGEVVGNFGRVPQSITGRPISWMGVYGVQPVDPEVAKLLNLGQRSGVVLSDIMEDGPAAKAGLQDRDIVLAIDDQPFPRFQPDRVVLSHFGQEILRHRPGDTISLTVLRGSESKEIKLILGDEPKMAREASRRYFDRLGFTAREFLTFDAIANRTKPSEHGGVVVHFLKPNSPAATAGLRPDDWIRTVDGTEVRDYAEATARLAAIEADRSRREFVLLASRGSETQVLRIKLD